MTQSTHGGKRQGAGRKPLYKEGLARVRVPLSLVSHVKQAIRKSVMTPSHAEFQGAVLLPAPLSLPLFATSVAAGFPSPADDYVELQLDLHELLVQRPSSTFYIKVEGDSMIDAAIASGDILTVDRSLTASHGDIVIAVVNNEFTVKRFYQKSGRVELHPENPDYQPIVFREGDVLQIWGVVVGVVRKLK